MNAIETAKSLAMEALSAPEKYASNLAWAEQLLLEALAQDPDDTLLLTGLGTVLCDLGKHEKATTVLRRAVELGSVDRNTFFNLGVAILNSGTHEEAMSFLSKANSLAPSSHSWEAYFDPQAH
jgi:Flp pilus assembly protein TadD